MDTKRRVCDRNKSTTTSCQRRVVTTTIMATRYAQEAQNGRWSFIMCLPDGDTSLFSNLYRNRLRWMLTHATAHKRPHSEPLQHGSIHISTNRRPFRWSLVSSACRCMILAVNTTSPLFNCHAMYLAPLSSLSHFGVATTMQHNELQLPETGDICYVVLPLIGRHTLMADGKESLSMIHCSLLESSNRAVYCFLLNTPQKLSLSSILR